MNPTAGCSTLVFKHTMLMFFELNGILFELAQVYNALIPCHWGSMFHLRVSV